ncbi:hypothetical protein [Methylomicrobium lacus]|uniref:hypothetical protein n=1 Tax=Methylomicrobium lacus TaxID=136992 RepID=UPI00045E6BE6|nr:hypothetical protein [Methylomicrobium lacus]
MNNKFRVLSALVFTTILFLNLQGCAYVSAKKIPVGSTEYEGFPYYMKKPLLVVSNDTVNIICVKDPANLWGIKIGAVLAKNKTKLEFGGDGCDNTIKIDTDLEDDAIAMKLFDTAGTALGEAMKAGLLGAQVKNAGQTGKFQIFDIVFIGTTGELKLVPLITNEVFNNQMLEVPKIKTAINNDGATIDDNPTDNNKNPNPIPPSGKAK